MENSNVATALGGFGGTPILTVNYDTLLEEALPVIEKHVLRFTISHKSVLDEDSLDCLWGEKNYGLRFTLAQLSVTHLHGLYWDRSTVDGLTLTSNEYNNNLPTFLKFMVPGIAGLCGASRRLVFVGCGDTVQDLHFWALWVVQAALRGAFWTSTVLVEPEHVWLVSDEEVDVKRTIASDIRNTTGVKIHVLNYGSHAHLHEFIASLRDDDAA